MDGDDLPVPEVWGRLWKKGARPPPLAVDPVPAAASDGPPRPAVALDARFSDVRELARGGMGVVLSAHDPYLHRDVAIKVLLPRGRDERQLVRRFVEEAQVTGQLEHPNIVPVYEFDASDDGGWYFAMRLAPGRSLADVLASVESSGDESAYPLARRLADFLKICDAVDYAHSRGVIHRDLKPANVMIGDHGEVLVVDWGLAKLLGAAAEGSLDVDADLLVEATRRRTRVGALLGTLHYMPPEQARGEVERIDERSDVYALGATLYQMLAFAPPVDGPRAAAVLDRVIAGAIVPPSRRAPARRIPREVEAIAMKALRTRPEDRYPNVTRLKEDVEAWLDSRPVSAVRYDPLRRAAKWVVRHRPVAAVAAAAVVCLVGLGIASDVGVRRERDAAVEARARAEELLERTRRHGRALELFEKGRRALDQAEFAEYRAGIDAAGIARAVEEARPFLEEAVEVAPELPLGPYLLGRAAGLLGRDGEAERLWSRSADLDPRFSPARFELGRLYLRRAHQLRLAFAPEGDSPPPDASERPLLDRAAAELEAASAREASGLEALQRLAASAWLALARGETREALELARTGLARHAGAPGEEEFDLLVVLLETDPARRRDACDRALAIRPGSTFLRLLRAGARFRAGDLAGATGDATAALDRDPSYWPAWVNRGRFRAAAGDHAGALADWDRALELDPGLAIAWSNRGAVFMALGRVLEAIESYDRALAIDPGFAEAWLNRGLACENRGDLDRALADYEQAIACREAFAAAWTGRARIRLRRRELDAARADLDRALEIEPDHVHALENRGWVRLESGDAAGAVPDFRRAVEVGGERASVLAGLGRAQLESGDAAGAARSLDRALELEPALAEAWTLRARARRAQGDRRGAIGDLERALEVDPANDATRLERARYLVEAGELDAAERAYADLLERRPDWGAAHLARSLLDLARGDRQRALADCALAIERGEPVRGRLTRALILEQVGDRAGAIAELETAHAAAEPGSRDRELVERHLAELRGR